MPSTPIDPVVCQPPSAMAFVGGACARRGLALRPLDDTFFRASRLALLGRLPGRPELHDRFARDRVGDTEVAAEVFEHAAELVQHRDHLRTAVDDALEIPPFANHAERLVTGPHQASADETLERGPHVAMRLDERLRVARLHPEANHVECRHWSLLSICTSNDNTTLPASAAWAL